MYKDLYDLCFSYLSRLLLSPLSLHFIYTDFFYISRTCQAYFHLKAFAPTISAILVSLPQIPECLPLTSFRS